MISVGSGGVEGTPGEVKTKKERRKLRSMTWDAWKGKEKEEEEEGEGVGGRRGKG